MHKIKKDIKKAKQTVWGKKKERIKNKRLKFQEKRKRGKRE